ncbi:unnamed protein product, partial [Closterium sp. NIES-54]
MEEYINGHSADPDLVVSDAAKEKYRLLKGRRIEKANSDIQTARDEIVIRKLDQQKKAATEELKKAVASQEVQEMEVEDGVGEIMNQYAKRIEDTVWREMIPKLEASLMKKLLKMGQPMGRWVGLASLEGVGQPMGRWVGLTSLGGVGQPMGRWVGLASLGGVGQPMGRWVGLASLGGVGQPMGRWVGLASLGGVGQPMGRWVGLASLGGVGQPMGRWVGLASLGRVGQPMGRW